LIDAVLALATAGHRALPKEGAVVVDDHLSPETIKEAAFALDGPLPGVSTLGTSLSSEGDEQEEGEDLEEVVDRALENVFG
jgi:hypothetical protein